MTTLLGNRPVYVVGIGLHPYQFPNDTPYVRLGLTAVREALRDAGIEWGAIRSAYVGTAAIGMAAGRVMFRHLGSTGLAVTQVESASASGCAAFRLACLDIAAGESEVVLAIGVDKFGDGRRAANKDGLTSLSPTSTNPVVKFALMAREYMRQYGLSAEAMARVAVKNHRNASLNPYAQFRKPRTLEQVLASPKVVGDLTVQQCCPRGDGAAAVVLMSERALARYGIDRRRAVRVTASVANSEGQGTADEASVIEMVRRSTETAYEQAGVGPADLDLVELHEAFSIEELIYTEAMGLCEPGSAASWLESGATEIGGWSSRHGPSDRPHRNRPDRGDRTADSGRSGLSAAHRVTSRPGPHDRPGIRCLRTRPDGLTVSHSLSLERIMMDLGTLTYRVEDGVAIVTLNRPDRMNTLGGTMKADLAAAFFEHARNDSSVRAIVLTGTGDRAFCAGADIKERAGSAVPGVDYYVTQHRTHELFRGIEEFEKPTIAAINGVALGGGLELALCCDIRIAASHARFGLPEVKLGVIPAAGGTQRLPRLVGESIAKELIFTSEIIDAQTAREIRLVNRVVDGAELMTRAIELAVKIAMQPPLAIRFAKRAVNLGMQVGMDAGLQYETYSAAMIVDSEDRKEGMRAFVEKRKPEFRGR